MLDRTHHEKIFVFKGDENSSVIIEFLNNGINNLEVEFSQKSAKQIRTILSTLFPEYSPQISSGEPIYMNIKAEA